MNSGKKCDPRIVFYGTPDFGAFILNELIINNYSIIGCVTQPDKPQGRKGVILPCPVKKIALARKIPILQPVSLSNDKFLKQLEDLKPNLAVVAAYGQIIPQAVLDIPKMGNINVHGSLLPKLRGASPIAFAILNGLTETGATIMLMDNKMDEGPILSQVNVPIDQEETGLTLTGKLQRAGAKLLLETICLWLEDKIKLQEQKQDQATYSKIIKKEDGRINWQQSASKIERQIRALVPWPGTYTFYQDLRLKILSAEVIDVKNKEIGAAFAYNGELAIGTKKNSLSIKKIQPAGKKEMSSKEFLAGYKKILGYIFN